MDRGDLPGFEFEVPHGPRQASGPRRDFGLDHGQYYADQGQAYADPRQAYTDQVQYYADQGQYYADQGQVYADPRQTYADQAQYYADQGQVYADPRQAYTNPEQVYADPRQTYADQAQYYADQGQVYADPRQTYADQAQYYADQGQVYADPRQTYADQAQYYADQGQVYADPRQTYADQAQYYADQGQVYADPRQAYTNPEQVYADQGQTYGRDPRQAFRRDSLRPIQQAAQPEPEPISPVRAASSGVLTIMRSRNWLLGLAVPILAAITVGIAVVVITGGGGNGGTVPSSLAAGFPPARLAGASFSAGTSRVVLTAIGASAGTEVTAGAANGGPALWTSSDGGSDWTRAALTGSATLTRAGTGEFTGVAYGRAGWLAVGTTVAAPHGPFVASSPNARTWTVTGGIAGGNAVATAVAAGSAGYVIVGHQAGGGAGAAVAAAWYARGLTGWQRATVAKQGESGGAGDQVMDAVTATSRGFAAVGASGTSPAAWLSANGRTWQSAQVPVPAGVARAALDYVAANGSDVVAAGTKFSATGVSSPFTEVSADAGATWTQVQLPVPDIGAGTSTTVTALTAAGGGFTAVGTYVTQAGPEVVIWTLPPGNPVTEGGAWTAVTPQGTGLASAAAENTITALAADGATLTGVGFTAPLSAPGAQQPTLWQSPIR